jgi:hypothetical protein
VAEALLHHDRIGGERAVQDAVEVNVYTTLLMATGLTFGSISALFGLTHHLINQTQYTELVTVVILSAFVPTLTAQQFFRPAIPGQTRVNGPTRGAGMR